MVLDVMVVSDQALMMNLNTHFVQQYIVHLDYHVNGFAALRGFQLLQKPRNIVSKSIFQLFRYLGAKLGAWIHAYLWLLPQGAGSLASV
ncbi:hypothetical protein ACU8KH_03187 [Lachancea thermotolerans]